MSRETLTWLNQNTLIGMTDKRGTAWHYRKSHQGEESNHYAGAIPLGDVERLLFDWEAIQLPAGKPIPERDENGFIVRDDDGKIKYNFVVDTDRTYVQASDTDETFSVFSDEYMPHQYRPWLLQTVGNILDDDLIISSAGLLMNRGVAWVEVSMPENGETEGFQYRPNLLATTSFNGKVATTFKRTVTATVCDNTLNAALGEAGHELKIKHTSKSDLRIAEAREALDIIVATDKAFDDAVKRLTDQSVSDAEWEGVLKKLVPDGKTDAGTTRAINTREKIDKLWQYDTRVAPWKGTAFGALQAWNTYNTHESSINSSTIRAEKVMMDVVTGKIEKNDQPMIDALAALAK